MRVHPGQYKGMSTLLTHYTELENAERAHIAPIYQNSVFIFEDTTSGAAVAAGEVDDYYYTRWNNPNHHQLARKLAGLEAIDILKQNPETDPDELV
ncbi:MAG: PLP-dependent transferase, partial [Candidatus Helarchaeota archaeon]